MASASLLQQGWDPWLVIPLMLLMGIAIGAVMGFFITYLKVQPFIATLAGMWFARGLCYVISDAEIRIYDPTCTAPRPGRKILIPGLADPVTKTGDYITILVVVALVVLAAGMYIAHYTRFGRTIYAMGGNNGANELSARLMGLPVDRTKIQVYMLNGFCSALAGLAYSIYVGSGHGDARDGLRADGHRRRRHRRHGPDRRRGLRPRVAVRRPHHGPHPEPHPVQRTAQLVVDEHRHRRADARVHRRPEPPRDASTRTQLTRARLGGSGGTSPARRRVEPWRDRRVSIGAGVVVALVLAAQALGFVGSALGTADGGTPAATGCQLKPYPPGPAADLAKGGAVIVYERNGGAGCVDELYAIYPDGRITGDNGAQTGRQAGDRRRTSPTLLDDIEAPRLVHRRHVLDLAHAVRPVLHVLHERDARRPVQDRPGRRRRDGRTGQRTGS